MVNLVWDQAIKRKYKKIFTLNIELKKSFWEAMSIFSQNPFDPKLRTHKLTGKLKGLWSFSVSYNYRVIFRFIVRLKFQKRSELKFASRTIPR
jgi:addiction module RelE/StbE family toxin